MKVIISQQDKKLLITLKQGNAAGSYSIGKADDFLNIADKRGWTRELTQKNLELEFHNTGMLTERIVRSIIKGLTI